MGKGSLRPKKFSVAFPTLLFEFLGACSKVFSSEVFGSLSLLFVSNLRSESYSCRETTMVMSRLSFSYIASPVTPLLLSDKFTNKQKNIKLGCRCII